MQSKQRKLFSKRSIVLIRAVSLFIVKNETQYNYDFFACSRHFLTCHGGRFRWTGTRAGRALSIIETRPFAETWKRKSTRFSRMSVRENQTRRRSSINNNSDVHAVDRGEGERAVLQISRPFYKRTRVPCRRGIGLMFDVCAWNHFSSTYVTLAQNARTTSACTNIFFFTVYLGARVLVFRRELVGGWRAGMGVKKLKPSFPPGTMVGRGWGKSREPSTQRNGWRGQRWGLGTRRVSEIISRHVFTGAEKRNRPLNFGRRSMLLLHCRSHARFKPFVTYFRSARQGPDDLLCRGSSVRRVVPTEWTKRKQRCPRLSSFQRKLLSESDPPPAVRAKNGQKSKFTVNCAAPVDPAQQGHYISQCHCADEQHSSALITFKNNTE
jgi:hypothetical protein